MDERPVEGDNEPLAGLLLSVRCGEMDRNGLFCCFSMVLLMGFFIRLIGSLMGFLYSLVYRLFGTLPVFFIPWVFSVFGTLSVFFISWDFSVFWVFFSSRRCLGKVVDFRASSSPREPAAELRHKQQRHLFSRNERRSNPYSFSCKPQLTLAKQVPVGTQIAETAGSRTPELAASYPTTGAWIGLRNIILRPSAHIGL